MPSRNTPQAEQSRQAWRDQPIVHRVPIEEISVETLDGSSMPAVVAWPDEGTGPWPVAVVLGELFGLTDVQRNAAERVAALGHVVIAPHLLHRRVPDGPLEEDDDGRARGL